MKTKNDLISIPRVDPMGMFESAARDLDAARAQIQAGFPPVIEVRHWVYQASPSRRMVYFKDPHIREAKIMKMFTPISMDEYAAYMRHVIHDNKL